MLIIPFDKSPLKRSSEWWETDNRIQPLNQPSNRGKITFLLQGMSSHKGTDNPVVERLAYWQLNISLIYQVQYKAEGIKKIQVEHVQ